VVCPLFSPCFRPLFSGATASNIATTAIGQGALASGVSATAVGQDTAAIGDYSLASGQGALASGLNSSAVGQSSLASGSSATSLGQSASASGRKVTAIGQSANASGDYSTPVGQGAASSGEGSTALGLSSRAAGVNTLSLGNGAFSSEANSVALGAGSVASRSNTVSVGSSFMQRTISDLAPGIEDTDAVNVSQLDDAARVSNRGIAGVSALAALPSIEPGKKFSAGLGVGYYENESAIGKIGTDHDEKSGQTTIKLRRSWGRSGSWADETVVCPLFSSPVFTLFSKTSRT